MPAKTRRYPNRGTVRLYRTVKSLPRETPDGQYLGGYTRKMVGEHEVRYAIEWDHDRLAGMVQKAAGNKSGTSMDGPIRVYVHPDDIKALLNQQTGNEDARED